MPPRQVALFASRGLGWATGEPIAASPDSAATIPSSMSSSPDRSSAALASSHDGGQHDATMQAEDGNVSFGLQSVGLSGLYVHSNVPGSLQVFIPAAHSHEPLQLRLSLRLDELDGYGQAAATATFAHNHTSPVSYPAQPGSVEQSSANGDREDDSFTSSMHDEEQSADINSPAASSTSPPLRAPFGVVPWNSQDDQLLREAVAANRGRMTYWRAVVAHYNSYCQVRHTSSALQARWRVLSGHVSWSPQADELLEEAVAANRGARIRWTAVSRYFSNFSQVRHTARALQARWRVVEGRGS